MTQIETPKVVKKKLFSPIWLLPLIALALGAWLGIKSIRESGVEVRIHFPSATGIDVGKTLVRYQGLTVGKVVDISIDDQLQGVYVDLLMDYRSTPFLRDETKFWLVTPKASITGVEGLDALFSGNYIAIQPGEGDYKNEFTAEDQAPPVAPGSDGLMIELTSASLGSLDVGSQVFYRQIPVGKIVSYRLVNDDSILFNAYIEKKYAHLVKQDSRFWNVSGLALDASLSGIKVKTESLSAILAGGVSFSSQGSSEQASVNQTFTIFEDKEHALGGITFSLTANDADSLSTGADIVYRGISIGQITQTHLTETGVSFDASIATQYAELLGTDSQFWLEGADLSLSGIKHASRLVTGNVVAFLPGSGEHQTSYPLLAKAPQHSQSPLMLSLSAEENPGIRADAEVRFKQLPIGQVDSVEFKPDYSGLAYRVQIWPEFAKLIHQGSYFVAESALAIDASLDGVSVNTRDLTTLTKGAISLVQGRSKKTANPSQTLPLFANTKQAEGYLAKQNRLKIVLGSPDGAGLAAHSPIYYKKMQIGEVQGVNWRASSEDFAIELGIDKQFASLVKPSTIFWRNGALSVDASLNGVKLDVAPLEGALKGSVSLGLLEQDDIDNQSHLYGSETLARAKATPISIVFDASTRLSSHAPIRYQGHQIGEVERVKLSQDLHSVNVDAYLYGDYAAPFLADDAQYFIVDANISLSGVTAAETLITGPYVSVLPGQSGNQVHDFMGSVESPTLLSQDALTFTLVDDNLGSVKIGTPIIFRGIKIGEVKQVQLSTTGTRVEMTAQIAKGYSHLVNQSSQFWDLSGIKVDLGLFSGAQIETGSLETIIAGGIGVATQSPTTANNRIGQHQVFSLQSKLDPNWLKWAPNQQSLN
ncbi:MlaD family protein [Shewanella rhizosphaerae]|uniref:PqiB family protein n=1 Tax=Shewanella rhizosphaerae TaxID=2864207 RepID=UPI001C65B496|nr:MlaD family protein [Shewanella rhizosphaerae]QYK14635.1 MlaD family protein [Shewanella rhizosphaerae]